MATIQQMFSVLSPEEKKRRRETYGRLVNRPITGLPTALELSTSLGIPEGVLLRIVLDPRVNKPKPPKSMDGVPEFINAFLSELRTESINSRLISELIDGGVSYNDLSIMNDNITNMIEPFNPMEPTAPHVDTDDDPMNEAIPIQSYTDRPQTLNERTQALARLRDDAREYKELEERIASEPLITQSEMNEYMPNTSDLEIDNDLRLQLAALAQARHRERLDSSAQAERAATRVYTDMDIQTEEMDKAARFIESSNALFGKSNMDIAKDDSLRILFNQYPSLLNEQFLKGNISSSEYNILRTNYKVRTGELSSVVGVDDYVTKRLRPIVKYRKIYTQPAGLSSSFLN